MIMTEVLSYVSDISFASSLKMLPLCLITIEYDFFTHLWLFRCILEANFEVHFAAVVP